MKIKGRRIFGRLLLWLVIILLLAGAILLGVLIANRPEDEPVEAIEESTLVEVWRVVPRDVVDLVRIPATIEPRHDVYLAAETAGRITGISVDKGDRVDKGDILLRIDSGIWEAVRRKAEAELRDAERDLRRYRELEKSGAVSEGDFENIQLRRDMAAADMERAEVELGHCTLRAPISGVVNDRMLDPGEYANEGAHVLELLDIDRVKVEMQVPEAYILAASAAEQMEFSLEVYPDRTFTGQVAFVAAKAGRQSNSFPVELECGNADGALKAGMIASVKLPGETLRDVVVLPLSSIIAEEGEYIVYIADGERAERRVVKLATILGREAVLAEGVSAGESVIVEGQRGLSDGRLISIVE